MVLQQGDSNSRLVFNGCEPVLAGHHCSKDAVQTRCALVWWRQDWLSPLCLFCLRPLADFISSGSFSQLSLSVSLLFMQTLVMFVFLTYGICLPTVTVVPKTTTHLCFFRNRWNMWFMCVCVFFFPALEEKILLENCVMPWLRLMMFDGWFFFFALTAPTSTFVCL